jgi:hypothetical protein
MVQKVTEQNEQERISMSLFTAEDYEPLPPGLYVGKLSDIESRERARTASTGAGAGRYWRDRTLGRKSTPTPLRTSGHKQKRDSGSRTSWVVS